MRSKGCSPRTNDLTRQPAVTDRQNKTKKRYPGCLAQVVSGGGEWLIYYRRAANMATCTRAGPFRPSGFSVQSLSYVLSGSSWLDRKGRRLLRGGILNRTYGTQKKVVYFAIFTTNIRSYLQWSPVILLGGCTTPQDPHINSWQVQSNLHEPQSRGCRGTLRYNQMEKG